MKSYHRFPQHVSARAILAAFPFLVLVLLAAGCGSDGAATVPPANAPPAPTVQTFRFASIGRLTALEAIPAAAIIVNGSKFETSGASIQIDGVPATASQLNLGDVVRVEGTRQVSPLVRAQATRIETTHVVQGQIESLNISRGSLLVLGQTVRVVIQTAYGDNVDPVRLSPGDAISVSGYRKQDGEIVATRIDRQASGATGFRTTGAITEVSSDSRFSIDGLVVDYRVASLEGGTSSALQKGVFVEVEGAIPIGGVLPASRVTIRAKSLSGGPFDGGVDIEGYITAQNSSDPVNFEIGGIQMIASTSGTVGLANIGFDGPVTVGFVASGPGPTAVARIFANGYGFTLTALPGRLQGRIFDAVAGPVRDAFIWPLAFLPDGSTYLIGNGPGIKSNEDGRFEVLAPGDSRVLMMASKQDYVRPCSVFIDASANSSFEMELVPQVRLDADNPPPPVSSTGSAVTTGIVYEQTASGRQPVAGAFVSYVSSTSWWDDGWTLANTVTDRNGRYVLCGLPNLSEWNWQPGIQVFKTGFQGFWQQGLPGGSSFDIELKRQ